MTYDYTMDKYMEKVSERNEDVQKAKKGFYLKELHGFVVVYLEDKKTIYEFTEIPLSDLPEEVRQEIAQGKQIATAEELYAFLENYSSWKAKRKRPEW